MAEISPSDIDISLHLVILLILVYGYYRFKVKHDFRDHGIIFTIATLLNTGTILLLMLPHLNNILSRTVDVDLHLVIVVGHSIIGTFAAVLSIFIVVRWYRHGKNAKACRGKTLMRVTFISWLTSLLIGAGLYFFG
jgi:hypothetical protein